MDRICKGMSAEEKETFDTDTMVGKKFRLDVVHTVKPDGSIRAKIESIKRVQATSTKPLKKVEEDVDDPYADE